MKQQIQLPSRFQQETPNPENWANIKNEYLLTPIRGGDGRVLIAQDPYKSRFDCSDCNGTGHTGETCPQCLGTKFHKGKKENGYCPDCLVTAEERIVGNEGSLSLGKVLCPTCHGRGGTIIIPDESKNDTTMGKVIAISIDGIFQVKVNDHVMYTNYTGSKFDFIDVTLRICVEKDLLCIVKKLNKNAQSITEQGFADLENMGVPHE